MSLRQISKLPSMTGRIPMVRKMGYRPAELLSRKMATTLDVAINAKKKWFTTKRLRKEGVGTHHTANKLVEIGLLEVRKVPIKRGYCRKEYRWTGKRPDIPCKLCKHVIITRDTIKRVRYFCTIAERAVGGKATCNYAADPQEVTTTKNVNQWL